MSWTQRYLVRHHVRNSGWILPVFGRVAGLVTVIRSKRSDAHGQNRQLVMKGRFNTRGDLRGY